MSYATHTATTHTRIIHLSNEAPLLVDRLGHQYKAASVEFSWTDDKAPSYADVTVYRIRKDGQPSLSKSTATLLLRQPNHSSAYDVAPVWLQELATTR